MPVVTEESEEKVDGDIYVNDVLDEPHHSNSSGSNGVPGQELGANELARENLNSIIHRRRNSQ